MALSGSQAEQLTSALGSAFPARDLFSNMLWFKCDQDLEKIAGPQGLDIVLPVVIKRAQADGWIDRLVNGALRHNPGSPELKAFYAKVWLALDQPPRAQLEAEVRKGNPYLDFDVWVDALVHMGPRVCRVEVVTTLGPVFGTGFLVAPDVVITNYHVLQHVIRTESGEASPLDPKAAAADVMFRFDYKLLPDRKVLNAGKTFGLSGAIGEWLLDSSKLSPAEAQYASDDNPAPDELDYAMVRLAGRPGDDAVRAGESDSLRGWIDMPAEAPALAAQSGLLILQHPQTSPLKLVIDMEAIERVNANRTRVFYRTNTLTGSSGAPCFDPFWNLVALHHAGEPGGAPKTNRGIPFDAILALMGQRGTRKHLGVR